MQRSSMVISFLIFFALVSIYTSLLLGSFPFSNHDLFAALSGHHNSLQQQILFSLRLPHTMSAFITGGLLGLTGTLMQVMLASPLADPFILGVSGGAAVFTMLAFLLQLDGLIVIAFSFTGAIIAMLLILLLVKNIGHSSPSQLLLTGTMLASAWGAMISLILTLAPNVQTKTILFWLFGDLDTSQYPGLGFCALFIGLIISQKLASKLNIFCQGALFAKTLGINTAQLQTILFILSSLLTAVAVSIAGTIGFIGLLIPHLSRLIVGVDHTLVIPCSVLLGGSLLATADTLARTLIAPEQLPIGIITALIGIPVFLYLLRNKYAGK
jgi:iron complex transport system permease protein